MILTLTQLYHKMMNNMGPTHWWPADSKTQIIIEALMIQNTNSRNAIRASALFAKASNYNPAKIAKMPITELEKLVKPAGFYHNKSRAVQTLFQWLSTDDFDYLKTARRLGNNLRPSLMKLRGIGDETADVLLTYVFDRPTFISDHYARLLFTELGVKNISNYQSLAKQIALPSSFSLNDAQEFHGLIDEFGKVAFHPRDAFQQSFLSGDQIKL
ncbi:endonuclease III domain-containing protein [Limosilactobacillus sp.]|uniref:endonuclease III domain-containing protein n=1 Tax=Limosilactobacillus sp. TaxID=2773925 RepID=UPI00345EAC6F